MLYTRGSEVVAAIQFTGINIKDVIRFAGKHVYCIIDHEEMEQRVYVVDAPNGEERLDINDYVVISNGKYYSCDSSIFDSRYDLLSSPQRDTNEEVI